MKVSRVPHAVIVAAMLMALPIVRGESSRKRPHQPLPLANVVEALELSRLAADNGMQELSLRAFQQCLAGGPPRSRQLPAVDAGAASRTRAVSKTPGLSTAEIVESRQRQIDFIWKQRSFNASAVYEALRDVVLPAALPDSVFLYQAPHSQKTPDSLAACSSISGRLIEWARRAGMLDDLMRHLDVRRGSHTHQIQVAVLRAHVGLVADSNVQQCLAELGAMAGNVRSAAQNDLIIGIALQAISQDVAADEAMALLRQCCRRLEQQAMQDQAPKLRRGQIEPVSTLLLTLALKAFRAEEKEAANDFIERYLRINHHTNQHYSDRTVDRLRRQQLQTAGRVLFAANEPQLALTRYQLAARLNHDSVEPSPESAQALLRYLMSLPPAEQYPLLLRLTAVDSSAPASSAKAVDGGTSLKIAAGVKSQGNARTSAHKKISLMTCLPPRSEPSRELLQSVGQRHGELRKPGSIVQPISTGNLLVDAAERADQLPTLLATLQSIRVSAEVGADCDTLYALVLCRMDQNGSVPPLVEKRIEAIGYDIRTKQKSRNLLNDYVLCAEILKHPDLMASGQRLAQQISASALIAGRPQIRQAVARLLLHVADPTQGVSTAPTPKDAGAWLSGSVQSVVDFDREPDEPFWVAHNNVIAHLAGGHRDGLYFRYPLTGSFDFVVDTYRDHRAQCGAGYGGLSILSPASGTRGRIVAVGGDSTDEALAGNFAPNACHETRIQVRPTETTYVVDGQPVYVDAENSGGFPWVSLNSVDGGSGRWRRMEIRGQPVVPSRIELSEDPLLRGWSTRMLEKSRPAVLSPQPSDRNTKPDTHDWQWNDGMIVGHKRSFPSLQDGRLSKHIHDLLVGDACGSVIHYARPLADGETITWEFEFQAGESIVSPVLGRHAVLLDGDRIRLRYLIGDSNWFGLSSENEAEPLDGFREAVASLLQPGWNTGSASLNGDVLTFSINGRQVCTRELPPAGARCFGFYHDSRRYMARVRNVRLSGDWSQKAADEWRHHLTRSAGHTGDHMSERLTQLIGESIWSANPLTVVRYAKTLPADVQYQYLKNWVLPAGTTVRIRVNGAARRRSPDESSSVAADASLSDSTIELVSPAGQLVKAAGAAGKLPELRTILQELEPTSEQEAMCHAGLMVMVDLAAEDTSAAQAGIRTLTDLIRRLQQRDPNERRTAQTHEWVPVLVAFQAVNHASLRADATELLVEAQRLFGHGSSDAALHRHSLLSGFRLEAQSESHRLLSPNSVWQPAELSSLKAHGSAYPQPLWTQDDSGDLRHWSGHLDDHLYLAAPIQGEFTLTCEMSYRDGRAMHCGYDGFFVQFFEGDRRIQTHSIGRKPRSRRIANAITSENRIRYKLIRDAGKIALFADGDQVFERTTSDDVDPWIMLRSDNRCQGVVRDFHLAGDFTIPRSIRLDTSDRMAGWTAQYYQEDIGAKKHWSSIGNVIHSASSALPGSMTESLLQYHRPMLEDGTIRYEFFYEPGKVLLHPAIGQYSFLLTPDEGVLLHELTDRRFDQRGKLAANRTRLSEAQLVAKLPLQTNAWNTMEVTVDGAVVTLRLNTVDVFRWNHPQQRNRHFGLFHYRDQTEGRARSFSWTGSWSDQLPKSLLAQ